MVFLKYWYKYFKNLLYDLGLALENAICSCVILLAPYLRKFKHSSLSNNSNNLLDAVFAKNEFVKNIIDISKSNIDAVDLGLDKNIKDKVLEKLDEITKSIELGRKI